jgi:hypothetical protein
MKSDFAITGCRPRSRPPAIAHAFFAQAIEGAGVARSKGTLALLVVK